VDAKREIATARRVPPRTENAISFSKAQHSIAGVCQVVQRSKQQDCVGLSITPVQMTTVAQRNTRERRFWLLGRARRGLLDMKWDRIDQVNGVSATCKPCRIVSRSAPYIQQYCGRWWNMLLE
jgi:hypothetical protein